MTDTARDLKLIPATTTEGLEDFFEPQMGQDHEAQAEAQDRAQAKDQVQAHAAHVTIAEAASILGVDRRYALRLAHKGKLRGFQDERDQWFISVDSINARMGQVQGKPPIKVVLAHVETNEDQDLAQPEAQDQVQPENQNAQFILEVLRKNEALTYRNGWLESKLEELQKDIEHRDQQIKLLTDSQHKPKLWHRLRSWFVVE